MRKMIFSSVCLTLVCAGCISQGQFDHRRDVDGDGYVSEQFGGEDCNDANPEVYPGAEDVPYDGVDADCDDWSDFDFDRDEMDAYEYGGEDCDDADPLMQNESFWFPDEDKDGYGDMKALVQACEGPLNYIRLGGDCDDTDAMIRPGVVEVCDGVDNNCDSVIDPPGSEGSSYFYPDSDSDGYGDEEPSSWEYVCTPSEGYTEIGGDCDDTDAEVSPAVEFEICNDLKNNNCAWEEDNCGIGGYGYAVNHGTITAVSNVRIDAPSSAEYTNAQLGFWAGGIGDVDQDGQDDFLISAPFQDVGSFSEAGAVYMFKGRDEKTEGGWGLSTSLNSSITRADRTILGSRSSGALGASAAALGDVNGDGYPDFALNHCGYEWGTTAIEPGSVEIVFGASNFWSLASAPTKIEITGMSGVVGKYTQTACAISSGDMDGDGHRDVVISNTGYGDPMAEKSTPPGAAFVFYGPFSTNRTVNDATVKVLPETGGFGTEVLGRSSSIDGDYNGDGVQDLVISTLAGDAEVGFGVGAVFLKYGEAGVRLDAEAVDGTMTASLDDFDARFSGDSNQSGAGEAIGAGDVNGDGVDDMVITAPKYDNRRGIVYVMPGANTANYRGEWSLWDADVRLRGNEEGDALGRTLSVVRGADTSRERVGVDGDDIADLWVGAAGQNPSEAAFLVNGSIANFNDTIGNVSTLGMFPLASYPKSQVPARDAYDGHITVGTLGDINGDKYVDVVASFPWYSEYADGNQNGVASIFLGGGE